MDDHPQSRNSPEPLGGFAQHSGLPSVRKTARQRLFGNTLPAQRIEGTVRVQFLAQSLDAGNPATWALGMWLVSPDGHTTLGELIPFGIGAKPFSLEGLRPYVVGPLVISPLAAPRRSRILIELGSAGGDARIELDPDEWVIEFEPAIEDNGPHPLQSRHVGRCIFCGAAAGLSREHIVPEGLNGEWTLHKASCPRCRDVTSRFETDVLKNAFGCVRVSLNMRTKHPENRPRQLPVRVKRGRAECDLFIDVADYPTIMNSPVFDPPGSVPIAQGGMRIRRENGVWIRQVAGPPLAEVLQGIARKNGYDYVGLRLGYQRFGQGSDTSTWFEVVGVVGNVRSFGLAATAPYEFYRALEQSPFPSMTVVIRTRSGDPETVIPTARRIVAAIDPSLPMTKIQTLDEVVSASVGQPRLMSTLSGLFGALAGVLAMVGVYGVMAYNVRRQRREFGIRLALGATRATLVRLVVGRTLALTGIGVGAGTFGAWAIGRGLRSMLNDVQPGDPAVFAGTAAAMLVVALLASAIPARAAGRVDPTVVLRDS